MLESNHLWGSVIEQVSESLPVSQSCSVTDLELYVKKGKHKGSCSPRLSNISHYCYLSNTSCLGGSSSPVVGKMEPKVFIQCKKFSKRHMWSTVSLLQSLPARQHVHVFFWLTALSRCSLIITFSDMVLVTLLVYCLGRLEQPSSAALGGGSVLVPGLSAELSYPGSAQQAGGVGT